MKIVFVLHQKDFGTIIIAELGTTTFVDQVFVQIHFIIHFFKSNIHIAVLVSQYCFHYQCLLNGVSSSVIMNATMNMYKLIVRKLVVQKVSDFNLK